MNPATELSPEFARMQQLSTQLRTLYGYAKERQAKSPEAQAEMQAFLATLPAFLQDCSNIDQNANAQAFFHITRKMISRLDPAFVVPPNDLQKICEIAARIYPKKETKPKSTYQVLCDWSSWFYNSITYLPGTVCGWMVNGNHPWKGIKYDLVIRAIIDAFKPLDLAVLQKNLKEIPEAQRTNMQKLTLELLDALLAENMDSQRQYQGCVDVLRKARSYPEFEQEKMKALAGQAYDPYIDYTLDASYYRFTEVHINAFCEELLTLIIHDGLKNLDPNYVGKPEDAFLQPLAKQFEAIKAASQSLKEPRLWGFMQSFFAFVNIYYDPQRKSNIPFVLCDLMLQMPQKALQRLRILRMGTPTINQSMVNEEFKQFITACATRKQRILYISEQDENWAPEAGRNCLIKGLKKEFPKNFFMAILTKDSPFYHQSHEFNVPYMPAQVFMNTFLEEMRKPGSGFYFDEEWLKDPSFVQGLSASLSELHEDIFSNKSILSRQERLDFIEIAYARFIIVMLLYLNLKEEALIDFLIAACRDSNDRAIITLIILLELCQLYLGKEKDPETRRMLMVFIHAAKMLVKKEEMNSRRDRLISVHDRFQKDLVQFALRKRFEQNPILRDIIIKKLPGQNLSRSV